MSAHDLGGVLRHTGVKGRRAHSFASCACGMTFVGRDARHVEAKHREHVERELEREARRPHRDDPRWARLREACCDIVGSGPAGETLDDYVDRVYLGLFPGQQNTTAGTGATLEGVSARAGRR